MKRKNAVKYLVTNGLVTSVNAILYSEGCTVEVNALFLIMSSQVIVTVDDDGAKKKQLHCVFYNGTPVTKIADVNQVKQYLSHIEWPDNLKVFLGLG